MMIASHPSHPKRIREVAVVPGVRLISERDGELLIWQVADQYQPGFNCWEPVFSMKRFWLITSRNVPKKIEQAGEVTLVETTYRAKPMQAVILRNGPVCVEGMTVITDEPLGLELRLPISVSGKTVTSRWQESPLREGPFVVYIFDGWMNTEC